MNAIRCDRCKKFYLESDDIKTRPAYAGLKIFNVELKDNDRARIRGFDLCADCALKLDSFLKGSDEVSIQQPFINKPCVSEGTCREDKIQVLDKIRAEIEALEEGITSYHNDRPWIFKDEVLQIIDKYKEESENKE